MKKRQRKKLYKKALKSIQIIIESAIDVINKDYDEPKWMINLNRNFYFEEYELPKSLDMIKDETPLG